MPAIPSWLLEPLWDQFAALLPDRGLSNNRTASGVSEPTRAELPPPTVPMRFLSPMASDANWRQKEHRTG